MSWLSGATPVAAAHIVLSLLALAWNVVIAGRVARWRETPRALGALSAIAGLAIIPALIIVVASSSLLEGRALYAAAWIWPVVATIVAVQAIYALVARLVAPPIGTAIAAYDVVLAVAYAARYFMYAGAPISGAFVGLAAAPVTALGIFIAPLAWAQPLAMFVPLLSPATPPPRRLGTLLRSVVALAAAGWLALVLAALPESERAVASYARYDGARLQERPKGDLVIGLKILPTVNDEPSPLALTSDLGLADSLGVGALGVYFSPTVTNAALDSLARSLDDQRGGRTLLVALDLRDAPAIATLDARSKWLRRRLSVLERVVRRLKPDYLVPALDPFGDAARALGPLPLREWERYFGDAMAIAKRADPDVTVLAHAGGVTERDSALVAWALDTTSPIEGIGIVLRPSYDGAASLEARMATFDRWLRGAAPVHEVWAIGAEALPMLHGEVSQRRALWGAMAWATRHATVQGLLVLQSSDYDAPVGLRAPGGRRRIGAGAVARAIKALGER